MKYWLYLLSILALGAAALSMVLRVPEGRPAFQVFEERISEVVKEEGGSQELQMKLSESFGILKASVHSRSERNYRADGFAFLALTGLSVALFVTAFLTPRSISDATGKKSPTNRRRQSREAGASQDA